MPRKKTPRVAAVNTKQAGEYLGLSESTLEKLRGTDRGPPFVTIEGSVRYRFSDLDAFLSSRTNRSIRERRQDRRKQS